MAALENKIDFVALISVTNANGNGDPLNGNRPRQTDEPLSEDGRQQLEKRKDQWAQVCRTWDMRFLCNPMTAAMTDAKA